MTERRKIKLVQAAYGAVLLTLGMQPIGMLGYGEYIWMLFMPLLLFFAFGADFKLVPSMIVCYLCGLFWAMINGILTGFLGSFLNTGLVNILTPVVVIFLLLTVHENFLEKTIFGNLPALFMGLASLFFTFLIKPANAAPITPIHLAVFFVYGVILALLLSGGGLMFCSLFFGKEKAMGALIPAQEE